MHCTSSTPFNTFYNSQLLVHRLQRTLRTFGRVTIRDRTFFKSQANLHKQWPVPNVQLKHFATVTVPPKPDVAETETKHKT